MGAPLKISILPFAFDEEENKPYKNSTIYAKEHSVWGYLCIVFTTIVLTTYPPMGIASSSKELNVSNNARWTFDLSALSAKETQSRDSAEIYTIGFDYFTKLTYQDRDIATIIFQPYWIQLNNVQAPPEFFDDGDDNAINWRITNINFTGLSRGKFNIRVGHFEVPFGIEQNLDSNGTLRQFTFTDRQIKADWGISANGLFPSFDYEFALTRGSGNNWTNRSEPYLVSGRIGAPHINNIVWGLSYFYGDLLTHQGIIHRRRVGADLAYYYYQWEFHGELSLGKDEGIDTENAWIEAVWNNRTESFKTYTQWQYRTRDDSGDKKTFNFFVIGAQWFISPKIDVSSQWQETLAPDKENDRSTVKILLRWRI